MPTESTTDRLLTTREAAELLGLSTVTLTQWRWRPPADCPRHVRVGSRAIRYPLSEISGFIQRRIEGLPRQPR